MNAEEAVRLARLAAAAGLPKWVKLEIHPDPRYLLPDPIETLQGRRDPREGRLHRAALHQCRPGARQTPAGRRHRDGDAARLAHRLQPRHRRRATRSRIIIEQATVPVVVDAGIGAPSHAAEAMEMGADAVLVNTAIAVAPDPNRMAIAFKMAVEAGRAAYESAWVPSRRGLSHQPADRVPRLAEVSQVWSPGFSRPGVAWWQPPKTLQAS